MLNQLTIRFRATVAELVALRPNFAAQFADSPFEYFSDGIFTPYVPTEVTVILQGLTAQVLLTSGGQVALLQQNGEEFDPDDSWGWELVRQFDWQELPRRLACPPVLMSGTALGGQFDHAWNALGKEARLVVVDRDQAKSLKDLLTGITEEAQRNCVHHFTFQFGNDGGPAVISCSRCRLQWWTATHQNSTFELHRPLIEPCANANLHVFSITPPNCDYEFCEKCGHHRVHIPRIL